MPPVANPQAGQAATLAKDIMVAVIGTLQNANIGTTAQAYQTVGQGLATMYTQLHQAILTSLGGRNP